MICPSKQEREIILPILADLHLENYSRNHQAQLMQALGFESDVPFAKSLFSDTVAQQYQFCKGEIEKIIATDSVACLPHKVRETFMKIVRLYHESKLLSSHSKRKDEKSPLLPQNLPDPNNIEQVIAFQKKMYEIVKNIAPHPPELVPLPRHPQTFPQMVNFSPFSIEPYRSYQQRENDMFPSIQSPYVPSLGSRSIASNFSGQIPKLPSYNPNERLPDRSKLQSFQGAADYFINISQQPNKESRVGTDNFDKNRSQIGSVFNSGKDIYEMSSVQPVKKIKRDEQKPAFTSMFPVQDHSQMIKQSVSEYVDEADPSVQSNAHKDNP